MNLKKEQIKINTSCLWTPRLVSTAEELCNFHVRIWLTGWWLGMLARFSLCSCYRGLNFCLIYLGNWVRCEVRQLACLVVLHPRGNGGRGCRRRVKVRTLDDLFRSIRGPSHVNVLQGFESFVTSLRYRASSLSGNVLAPYAGGDRFECLSALLTEVFRGFSYSFQANAGLVPRLGHGLSFQIPPNSVFIYHQVKYKVFPVLNWLSIKPWRRMGEWRYSFTILDLGTRRRWVVSFKSRALHLGGTGSSTHYV
jgi:hypothetical protein